MENGKSPIAKGLLDRIGFGTNGFHVLRPLGQLIADWVWLFMRRKDFRAATKVAFRGGVDQQRVPAEFLRGAVIPLPPLPEERRVVARQETVRERTQVLKEAKEETRASFKKLERSILDKAFHEEL